MSVDRPARTTDRAPGRLVEMSEKEFFDLFESEDGTERRAFEDACSRIPNGYQNRALRVFREFLKTAAQQGSTALQLDCDSADVFSNIEKPKHRKNLFSAFNKALKEWLRSFNSRRPSGDPVVVEVATQKNVPRTATIEWSLGSGDLAPEPDTHRDNAPHQNAVYRQAVIIHGLFAGVHGKDETHRRLLVDAWEHLVTGLKDKLVDARLYPSHQASTGFSVYLLRPAGVSLARLVEEGLAAAIELSERVEAKLAAPDLAALRCALAVDVIDDIRFEPSPNGLGWTGWPGSTDRAAKLCQTLSGVEHDRHLGFGRGPDNSIDEARAYVLATGDVVQIARHRFSFEPVGEFQEGETFHDVHRVWTRLRHASGIPRDAASRIEAAVSDQIAAVRRASHPGSLHFLVPGEVEGQQVGEAVVERLQLMDSPDSPSPALVLHCKGHSARRYDLLQPVTEALREHLRLNRRFPPVPPSGQGGEPYYRKHLVSLIESLVDRCTNLDDSVTSVEARDKLLLTLTALFLGGSADDSFSEAVGALANLLKGLDVPVWIVFDNFDQADELSREFIRKLLEASRKSGPTIICVSAAPATIDASSRFTEIDLRKCMRMTPEAHSNAGPVESLGSEERELLQVAAALPWGFLRHWLLSVWQHLPESPKVDDGSRSEAEFGRLLSSLLRRGLLKYAGCLADVSERVRDHDCVYRELRIDSIEVHRRVASEVAAIPDLRRRILNTFRDRLLAFFKTRAPEDVRLKIRVCQMLADEAMPPLVSGPELENEAALLNLLRLWTLVSSRAYYAGASEEALRRVRIALETLSRIHDPTSVETLGLAAENLARLIILISQDAERPEGEGTQGIGQAKQPFDFEPAAEQTSIAIRAHDPSNVPVHCHDPFFALERNLWAREQRIGILEKAALKAEGLHALPGVSRRPDLQLESKHVGCITRFSLGDFEAAAALALDGAILCELNPHFPKDGGRSPCFGRHDGGACCKAFRALSLLLWKGEPASSAPIRRTSSSLEALSAAQMLKAAMDYAAKGKHGTTRLIMRAYSGLFHILAENWNAALLTGALDTSRTNDNPTDRWSMFHRMMICCARIGMQHKLSNDRPGDVDPAALRRELTMLDKLHTRWNCDESAPLWCTFQAVGNAILGDKSGHSQAEACFSEALEKANRRGEVFFVPETYRYLAWFRKRRSEIDLADAAVEDGLNLAKQLKATLYLRRLEHA